MRKLRILSVLCVVVMALTMLPLVGLADTTAYVSAPNGKAVNARSSMLTHCNNRVDSLPNGYKVSIISNNGTWSYCSFTHTTRGVTVKAYIQSRYLSGSSSAAITGVTTEGMMIISPTTVTVNPSSPTGYVNLRQAATKQSSVLARYYQGQTLTMTAKGSTWAQVYDPSTGRSGYMMLAFLR